MTTPPGSDHLPEPSTHADGRPRLIGRVGSLDAFWPLVEPVLAALRPRRMCEIGVDRGIFTNRLLAWGKENGCVYIGIDPAPDPAVTERVRGGQGGEKSGANDIVIGRSLDVLRELAPCEVYFIDGDHNHHTVRGELELIARANHTAGPIVFAHDVSWPFARRDMYHQPEAIPPAERHPHSADLGVSLDGDELIAGGLRSQGRYAIALHAGGPRNGVLTAIEDFLTSDAGRGWQSTVLPIAYGLAVLYRSDSVPGPCRERLDGLRTAIGSMGEFLESCEANLLQLYLYSEHAKAQIDAYSQLEKAYAALGGAYKDLTTHSEALLGQFNQLLENYRELDAAFRRVSRERDDLQTRLDSGADRA